MKFEKIIFPKDGKPHKSIMEWWYFNGHLKDEKGNDYSFMNCLFKANVKKVNVLALKVIPHDYAWMHHQILSDFKHNKVYADVQPLVILSKDSFSKELFYINYIHPSLKRYVNYEINEISKFNYRVKSEYLDLTLINNKKPLLEGGKGFLKMNKTETYYYSLTNMSAEGYIIVDDKPVKVKGIAWLDHQWADESYKPENKWTWFSFQFDNNHEMVCFEFDDSEKKHYLAHIIDNKGNTTHTNKVIITPKKDYWESPHTGATYNLSWNVKIPSMKIEIDVEPMMRNQELLFGSINYWEGPIRVKGKMKGKNIKGKGFMELVGTPTKKSLVTKLESELVTILKSKLIHFKKGIMHALHKW